MLVVNPFLSVGQTAAQRLIYTHISTRWKLTLNRSFALELIVTLCVCALMFFPRVINFCANSLAMLMNVSHYIKETISKYYLLHITKKKANWSTCTCFQIILNKLIFLCSLYVRRAATRKTHFITFLMFLTFLSTYLLTY